MNQNILGILVSYLFVFAVIGLSTVLQKKSVLDNEGSRKLIHIGVGHWWFIAIYFFTNAYWASLVPLSFVFINYLSHKINLFKSMERGEEEGLGTVYYALSLLILTFISFSWNVLYMGGIGILIMTYADGFAAIVGKTFGKHRLIHNKTLEGSLAVFILSFLIAYGYLSVLGHPAGWIQALIIGLCASLIELLSPHGYDNLSLPLGVSVLVTLMSMVF
jgi:phytol kinase